MSVLPPDQKVTKRKTFDLMAKLMKISLVKQTCLGVHYLHCVHLPHLNLQGHERKMLRPLIAIALKLYPLHILNFLKCEITATSS